MTSGSSFDVGVDLPYAKRRITDAAYLAPRSGKSPSPKRVPTAVHVTGGSLGRLECP